MATVVGQVGNDWQHHTVRISADINYGKTAQCNADLILTDDITSCCCSDDIIIINSVGARSDTLSIEGTLPTKKELNEERAREKTRLRFGRDRKRAPAWMKRKIK